MLIGSDHAYATQRSVGDGPRSKGQDSSQALQSLVSDYWEAYLHDNPQDATAFGDKRYNDRWSDLSKDARNHALRRSRDFAEGPADLVRALERVGVGAAEQDRRVVCLKPIERHGPFNIAATLVGQSSVERASLELQLFGRGRLGYIVASGLSVDGHYVSVVRWRGQGAQAVFAEYAAVLELPELWL
jgi:hypothetical protein